MAQNELHRVTAEERISSTAQVVQSLSLEAFKDRTQGHGLVVFGHRPDSISEVFPTWVILWNALHLGHEITQEPAGLVLTWLKCEQSFAHQVPPCLHQCTSSAVSAPFLSFIYYSSLTQNSTLSKWPTEALEFPPLLNSAAPLDPLKYRYWISV